MTATNAVPEEKFRLKIVPIVVTVLLGIGLPIVAAVLTGLGAKAFHYSVVPGANLRFLFIQHGFQFLLALVVIAILKFWLVPADYGLHWPRGKTYILPAILWAASYAVITTALANWSLIATHTKPDMGFSLTPENIWGWTFFQSIYVGPTEEIPFRALLVTYLAAAMPGKFRVGRYEMNWAGIIVALIFAFAHISSFFTGDWQGALIQQCCALFLGVCYAYWLEKSKSIVAPIIAHNISDGLVYVILFFWVGAFSL